ncbi:conserved hypothetical protein [Magnetococcus marinus MC-1]|uniref:Uncharacterized protein n=1 Tax=Magnetococcus marinus (strain ATCC BAA-1437 / JCM 17883 / MC-1) TaxID=156889 RepID=A0LB08_MAGMM|nr:hypothetical protein [Magnetococcus marinus]ABK45151.1 conserved hypothetical protein [Magnetococcus marinus MC-1]
MDNNWNDFNNAESQQSFDLIPKGTIAPVRMTIKPGGYDDPNRGWTGGYATRNADTGAVFLKVEYVITEGKYAKRKVWSNIGLFSQKGPEWGNMGRSFIRAILNSSRGLKDKDNTPQAQQARRINGLADLDGLEFLAKIDVEKDQRDDSDKNTIKFAITPDHKEYQGFSGGGSSAPAAPPAPANQGWQQPAQQQAPQQPQQQATSTPPTQTPSWAQ